MRRRRTLDWDGTGKIIAPFSLQRPQFVRGKSAHATLRKRPKKEETHPRVNSPLTLSLSLSFSSLMQVSPSSSSSHLGPLTDRLNGLAHMQHIFSIPGPVGKGIKGYPAQCPPTRERVGNDSEVERSTSHAVYLSNK